MVRFFLVASSILVVAACSSSSGTMSSSSGSVDAGPISFKTDVVAGILNNSCGFSSCHGSTTAPQGGLFLGLQTAKGSDASQVRGKIVGVNSGENPTMPYITAGDPTKSFLMHKMDGDQDTLKAQCTGQVTGAVACGVSMPQGSDLLPQDTRDKVRAWIAQGALDN
jgi:hypothetical protein